MKKDSYYFPHFSNARNDSKIIRLRRIFGIEGYGIYFMLLEVLREQTFYRYPISGIEDLAFEWHIGKEKIMSIVNDFDLFNIENNAFFSPKQIFYLQPYIEKSERARIAANKRWNNANAYANALPEQCGSNASKVKESKEKKSKVKKSKVKKSKKTYNREIVNFTGDLSKFFPEYIIKNLSETEKYNWIDTIDKLSRIDKYTNDEIKQAVDNARNSEFWARNFLSLTKLRKKNDDGIKYINIFLELNRKPAAPSKDDKLKEALKYVEK